MSKRTDLALRSANRATDSTFDRLWKYYYDKHAVQLSEKEEEIRKRLVNIWDLLSDILTDRQAIRAHVQWCEDNGYHITERWAQEDLRLAKMLFGDRKVQIKSAKRAITGEWLMKAIQYAWEKKDLDSYANLILRYNKLFGLESDTDSESIAERQAIQITFSSDPETLKKEMQDLRRKAESANAQDVKIEDE